MKEKIAAFVAGITLCLFCFLGAGRDVQAEEPQGAVNVTPYTAYLSMKSDTDVYVMPGTSWAVLGRLQEGQPAIATGKTDNGWFQIYYIGMIGYIPGDATQTWSVPGPTIWGNIAIEGDIKINALGDSITYGDKLSDRTLAYPNVVAAKTGAVKLNNYGWNGSSMGGPHPDRFIDRYPTMDRDANLILVLGGTNDYGDFNKAGTPIGALGDLTPDTFYGSLNLLMCGLKQMYPDGEIVFMTPLRRVGYMRRNQNGYYLNQYAFAIQDMAAFWGVRVIDLLNEPELDFSSKQSVYLVDGLHPNPTGHALLGACVYRRLFENPY
jgi:lysophospholipase L1-like esterase